MSDEKLDLIFDELKKINSRMDSHEQLTAQLVGIVKSTNEKVAVLEVKMSNVEEKLTNVEQRLTNVEEKLTNVEQRLTNVEQKTSNIEQNVLDVRKGQERQDRILEALAMRSLEQETDIREIKRAK